MKITQFGKTDIGKKRKNNQDSFLINEELKLFVVADGMGGHQGGEVASKLCVEVLEKFCKDHPQDSPKELLSKGINASCEAIYNAARKDEALIGMGTTVVALLLHHETVYIGQVGDSRAYLLTTDGIWQITEDHSLLNEELRAGRLQMDQAQDYQFKNVITRSVGYESKVVVDIYQRTVKSGDLFLMCSDGLSGLVEPGEMLEAFNNKSLKQAVTDLIELANMRGGDDNISVIACRVE